MFQRIRTSCLLGIKAIPVHVEVDSSAGLPGFTLVGLPDNAVRESRERVVSSIRSSGYAASGSRMTVNLSPADLKKEGTSLDLPLAIGMLIASEEIQVESPEKFVFMGELSLDGKVKAIRGVLSVAMSLSKKNDVFVVPKENVAEASLVEGLSVIGVSTLSECIEAISPGSERKALRSPGIFRKDGNTESSLPNFRSVVGMEGVKRALEIAAAGAHNFLLVGSPGSGKTFSARCLPGILPPMTDEEILECTQIYSSIRILGDLGAETFLNRRPFRSPHHSSSMVALVGGGPHLRPGEASLAHNGVLFLDELPEFNRNVLEALREPMEEGIIRVSRACGTVTWPARFMMGAAMNPCPCGYSMDAKRGCTCLPDAVRRYRQRVSGPMLDRIDIQVAVPSTDPQSLMQNAHGESSATIRERVIAARNGQRLRFAKSSSRSNAEMSSEETKIFARMDVSTEHFAVSAAEKMRLSARGYYRMLKVARTIADLRVAQYGISGIKDSSIECPDVAEALRYRAFADLAG
ncbi:magnesium chelatase family protein [Fibrobacter intestinalis]|uniref:Magnesium chelatase family protein n=2 Tax=Fibrobacter TaxID=832 RepID=A0A1M6QXU1_9BACT|nr:MULTISPECIES: YifB family Mg chelatase-like AAA ATPase [Fibrobacter]PBC66895.1 magnesium chelatase family protein [Fibrobacter sp. UWS1]SHK24960.1 magnesium chelatase family protein [Fibrobacter intestinalis]